MAQAVVLRAGVPITRDDLARRCWALAQLFETLPPGPIMPLFRRVGDLMVGLMAAQQGGRSVILPHDEAPPAVRMVLAENPQAQSLCAPGETAFLEFSPHIVDMDSLGCGGPTSDSVWREDLSVTLYTSGTTGRPVGHCHGRPFILAAMAAWRAAIMPDEIATTLIATVPGQHMFGFESSVLLPLACPWLTVQEGRPFYPADIVQALLSAPNRRLLITTPLHLRALLEQKIPLPPIYRIVTATAPLSHECSRSRLRC